MQNEIINFFKIPDMVLLKRPTSVYTPNFKLKTSPVHEFTGWKNFNKFSNFLRIFKNGETKNIAHKVELPWTKTAKEIYDFNTPIKINL